ncbi:hypothetical protein QF028_001516 [Neobacillus sp. B4I6]|uniref:nitrous oxide reductase accessory protein NosL n=1 Tax=Neobacillus sp. B4I6 TaxID=3373925 RepID=UPI003D1E43F5
MIYLVEEGYIMKTFGGITLVREVPGVIQNVNECVLCNCQIISRFVYKLILPNNIIENACCAHCGIIRQYQLGDNVIQALCNDFLTDRTVSASLAWFVMNSSLRVGCCRPQILSFENKEHADKFVQAFGGKVFSFQETLESIHIKQVREKRC